jgi:hypothetical protein
MEQSNSCNPSVAKTMRHELVHLVASVVLAFVLGIYFGNYLVGLWAFSLCMFLDGDHLFDYGLYILKTNKNFDLKEFLSGSYFADWKKFITPLHSWEMVIVFAVIYFFSAEPFFIATSLALAIHYFVDYFTNDVNKKAYFLFYRARHKFAKASIRKDF